VKILFVVELPFDSLTGGSLYERSVVDGLRARGHDVQLRRVAQGPPLQAELTQADVVLWDGMSLISAQARWGRLLPGRPQAAIVHSPFSEPWNIHEPWIPVERTRLPALERDLFARVDRLLVPSLKIRDLLVTSYGADPAAVSVHPPTAHLPVERMPPRSLAEDRWLFVSVGSVTARKNQLVLLEALADVRPGLFGGRPWTLRLVGRSDAEPGYVARVKAAARELAVQDRVTWGPAETAELLALVSASHLHLFPTLDEGFGMAVYETLCAGVPTVFVAGRCALGSEGESIPPVAAEGGPRAWTSAIESYLAEPERWEALAAAGRRRPRSWDQVTAGIEEVLAALTRRAS
jgi:glycosyltransferase involved in cell wall biosynthesis